jgi:hypothetical protein
VNYRERGFGRRLAEGSPEMSTVTLHKQMLDNRFVSATNAVIDVSATKGLFRASRTDAWKSLKLW